MLLNEVGWDKSNQIILSRIRKKLLNTEYIFTHKKWKYSLEPNFVLEKEEK